MKPKKPKINLDYVAIIAQFRVICWELVKNQNNKGKTAKELGIDRKTLYLKMEKYGIE